MRAILFLKYLMETLKIFALIFTAGFIKVLKEKINLLSTILNHVSVRWFSLERCMDGILHNKPISKAYFLSGSFREKSFERLDEFFRNLPLNPAQLFQSNAVQFSFILISYCKEINQEFIFLEH